MRKIFILATILASFGVTAFAQADRTDPRADEYRAWMQSIPPELRSLTTNIKGKMGDMAVSDADKLKATFKQVEDFWGQRNVQDAVLFAQTAQKALTAVSKDAKAGNTDAGLADLKALQETCSSCHMAHREGATGSFTIK